MIGRLPTLRFAALLASATLAVHELRFLLAPVGGGSPSAGHAYLSGLGVAVALVLALACAQLARRVALARRTGSSPEANIRFGEVWMVATLVIVAAFCVQELLEGALAAGRATGLEAMVGDGAWVALPLAAVMGLLVAIGSSGAAAVLAAAARRRKHRAAGLRRPRRVIGRARDEALRPVAVLAGHSAGRSPPALRV